MIKKPVRNMKHLRKSCQTNKSSSRSAALRFTLAALTILGAAGLPAHAGDTTFSVDAAAVQSFLRAVTPYDVVVGQKDIQEVLTLFNPRDVRFEKGKVRLKLDCRGAPIPIEMVLDIAIGVKWDEEQRAWMAYLASLPVTVPLFGTFDLAKYIDPYPIPQTFSQPAGNDEVQFSIDGLLKSLKILDDKILVEADLTFRNIAPPEIIRPEAAPAPSGE